MWVLSLAAGAALADQVRVTVDLADLLADRVPALVGAGSLQACSSGGQSLAALQQHLGRAEGALPLLDLEEATQALDLAAEALGCLDEAVAGSLAARVAYLRGLVAVLDERPDQAQEWFMAALALRPALEWDRNWAPDLRPPYDAAQAATRSQAPALLTILGTPEPGTLWLDGRPLVLRPGVHELSPGVHYLQLAGSPWQTWTLTLTAGGEGTLLLPGALGPEALAWAQDPAQHHRLAPLLGLVVAPDSALQVHAGGQAFDVAPDTDSWALVREPRHPGRWIAVGGGSLAAGAAMVAALSWAEARGAVQDANDAAGWGQYVEAGVRYDGAATRYRSSWIAEGVGLAVLGVGLAVEWRFGGGR